PCAQSCLATEGPRQAAGTASSDPREEPSPPLAASQWPPIVSIRPQRFQRRQRSSPRPRAGAFVTSHSSSTSRSSSTDPLSPGRLRLVILALSLGAFAIGTTEF